VINGIVFTRTSSTTPLNPPVFAGQVVRFTADVLDPEGQPLTYTWSIDGGSLSDPMEETPTWYSDEVTRLSAPFPAWDVQVQVSDGVNPPVSFTQPLSVRSPSFVNDVVRQGVLGSTAFNGCANSGCHGNALTPSGGFSINVAMTSSLHAALLANHNKGPTCSIAMRRVQAFNPMGSLLYRKLLGGLPVGCGAPMPFMRGTVAPNELIILRSWINAGALQN
jgi:hypothetical protein